MSNVECVEIDTEFLGSVISSSSAFNSRFRCCKPFPLFRSFRNRLSFYFRVYPHCCPPKIMLILVLYCLEINLHTVPTSINISLPLTYARFSVYFLFLCFVFCLVNLLQRTPQEIPYVQPLFSSFLLLHCWVIMTSPT